MAAPLRPQRFALVNCPALCSLNVRNLPEGFPQILHAWYEEGLNDRAIQARAAELNVKIGTTPIWRHRTKHLAKVVGTLPTLTDKPDPQKKRRSELEVLDEIIARGADSVGLPGFRVTAEMLMKAMELKLKMTQGSAFDALLGSLREGDDEDLPSAEDDAAAVSGEERAQAAPVELD